MIVIRVLVVLALATIIGVVFYVIGFTEGERKAVRVVVYKLHQYLMNECHLTDGEFEAFVKGLTESDTKIEHKNND